jgi:hypothetical protein
MNPRNLKNHIDKQHKDDEYIPQMKKNYDQYIKWKEEQEQSQIDISVKVKKKPKNKRAVKRYECGKFIRFNNHVST